MESKQADRRIYHVKKISAQRLCGQQSFATISASIETDIFRYFSFFNISINGKFLCTD